MTASQDQSMEEILQSIKRIIAEENEDDAAEAAAYAPASTTKQSTGILELSDTVEEEEPLELEDLVEDDDFAAIPATEETFPESPADFDVMSEVIEAESQEAHIDDVYQEVSQHIASVIQDDEPEADAFDAVAVTMPAEESLPQEDSLVSDDVAKHAASAFHKVIEAKHKVVAKQAHSSMQFRSGTTIEDLTMELLKPVMKEWLDTHLQPIVERLVEQEIKRLAEAE